MTRAGDNLLLFSSDSGKLYGYDFDGPKSDGAYHYTGEGQIGDQTFVRNNRLLRDHAQLGLHPRLFERVKGPVVRYVGEYQLASDRPYYPEEARDVNGDTRKVIVFRLLPVGSTAPGTPGAAPAVTVATVRDVPIEDHVAETFQTTPTAEPTTAEKREANLVRRYTKYLEAHGSKVTRKEIRLPDLGHPLYSDLFDNGRGELVEAKSSASRNHVRLALGQLLDYARYVKPERRAVLLPSDPGDDLVKLLHSVGVTCVYESENANFVRLEPPNHER
jgi:hypothetical protein